ncbi:hypothetical protein BGX23_010515 [Mortierella sp. AD031]|nr:hypothetical protein BGX23_010515 [Mortierella sp. AD031]
MDKDKDTAMDNSEAGMDLHLITHHHQRPRQMHQLPQEIQDIIIGHLTQHDLTVCALVCQSWFDIFSLPLWRTVKPYPSQSYNWGAPMPEIWLYRFCYSLNAGALARNGQWIQSLTTNYHSVIDLLRIHDGISLQPGNNNTNTCTELRELAVGSEMNPPVPTPTQDFSMYTSSAMVSPPAAFGGKKPGFGRTKHTRPRGPGTSATGGTAGGFEEPVLGFGSGRGFGNTSTSSITNITTTSGFGTALSVNPQTQGSTPITSNLSGGPSGSLSSTGSFTFGASNGIGDSRADCGFGGPGGFGATLVNTSVASPFAPPSTGFGAFVVTQAPTSPALPATTFESGAEAGLEQNSSFTNTIATATPSTSTAAAPLTPTSAFSGFESFNRLTITASTTTSTTAAGRQIARPHLAQTPTAIIPFRRVSASSLGSISHISFAPSPTSSNISNDSDNGNNNDKSSNQPFVFGSGATTKSMSFTDVYGPGIRDYNMYSLACLSQGISPVSSKAALIWLLQQNPHLEILSIKGHMFLKDFFTSETSATSKSLGVQEATVVGVLRAIPKGVRTLTLHHEGRGYSYSSSLQTWVFDKPRNNNNTTTTTGGGDSADSTDLTPSPPHLPLLDSLERLNLLGDPLDESLSVLRRLPVLRTLWINLTHYMPFSYETLTHTLRNSCPHLFDCVFEGAVADADLSLLLSQASNRGWRTLIFKSKFVGLGPKSIEAILQHAAGTLETIRFDNSGPLLRSHHVHRLLCTAPNLKRFVGLLDDRSQEKDVRLDAGEVFGETSTIAPGYSTFSDWACVSLESFRCKIIGIPRPDLKTRTNGRPLTGPLHSTDNYTLEDSYRLQRQIYSQLGRLCNLKELCLGSDYHAGATNFAILRSERWREGTYYDALNIQQGRQDECLSMTLESGLDLLSGLKELRGISLSGMQTGFWKPAEQEWTRKHWPKLKPGYWDPYWDQFGYKERSPLFVT